MKFLDLVRQRRSVRRYMPGLPVPREALERCLEAARLAPSACNAQPWRFVVVDEPGLVARVARETFGPLVRFNRFVLEAPALVVCVAEEAALAPRAGGALKGIRYSVMDMGIAAEHFCLQAAEEGLGTCMLGWFDKRGVKRVLGIPRGKDVLLVISVGYPASGPEPETSTETPTDPSERGRRPRKDLDQVRSYNRYRFP